MPAADATYSVPNYEKAGGAIWHVGGTLELGNSIVIAVNAGGVPVWSGVPTADPHVVGALWANTGVLTLSAG
jgi:hypothetical protein